MTNDTQKTWTLKLTPEGGPQRTITGISQDEMTTLLREAVGGFQPLETIAGRFDRHEQPLAA